jgi:tetratricopeptide (TPR) repeat protein
MKCRANTVVHLTLLSQLAGIILYAETSIANPKSNFAQIVLPLASDKKFTYEWSKADNSLHLFFPNSAPNELDAFNNYDESLVRRVLIKDLGSKGTEIKIVLRDQNVEGLVSTFSEPSRVVLDLFEKNAKEQKDANTGLPTQVAMGLESDTTFLPETQPNGSKSRTDSAADPRLKKRLIQKMAPEATTPNELTGIISKSEPGLGKAWASFPTYIYRMQLASLEIDSSVQKDDINKLQSKALSTSGAMADYAAKLFDLGHEARALAAYQQVLQREPEVFEKSVTHLWRLAESHLGVGNLTLAEGYYQTLLEKFPNHVMARFAKLRKLDVQAVRAVNSGDNGRLAQLNESVLSIPTRGNAELMALIAIRSSWWEDQLVDQKSRTALAACSEETENELNKILPKIENPKTAYLSSAMIAKRMSDSNTPWQNNYATWLGKFFDRYRQGNEPITVELSDSTRKRLINQFQSLFENNQFAEVVALYEQLPKQMQSIAKDGNVSWQIAESYRSLGQADSALGFYDKATASQSASLQFRGHFWMAAIAAKKSAALKQRSNGAAQLQAQKSTAYKHDRSMQKIWSQLSADDKNKLMTGLGSEFKLITASDMPLSTPAKIVLEQYKVVLSENPPKLEATPGTNNTDWLGNFSPSGATVKLLDDLGRKFAELGMPKERREAMQLMRFIKPTQLEQDKIAAKLWAAEMTKLAEDHRKADEFLEAGQIYTQIGDVTALDDARAESLYKGGLLLFRAGKKDDAIKALEKAKGDPNNLFYSKLATERLNQMGH